MKRLLLFGLMGVPLYAGEKSAPAPEWPLIIAGARAPIVLYQPQPESFKDDKLTARAAVSVQPDGQDPVFGAAWMEARVDTDRTARTVTVKDIRVTRTRFAGANPEKEQLLSNILTDELTKRPFVISLDRLLTSLQDVEKVTQTAIELKNDPPKIYVEEQDTMLVILDGEPQLREGRVVNTPYDLQFVATSKQWRLKAGDRWLIASDLNGPWKAESKSSVVVPKVIISKEPAEAIVSKGAPVYTPLAGTGLTYMSNSDNNVFVETATSKIYILFSGRWFSASSLSGPWTFVQPDELPEGFAKIPPDSAKASVLASVAGTPAAQEAVLDAQIPQTTAVSRKERASQFKLTWDGEPKFKDLEVLEVAYSLNASAPVFRVGKEGYWACDQGVWYMAKKPTGPWVVADRVPGDIYKIPTSCPYYNCRYVHIYDSTPEVVYVGYYPGYVGSYPYNGVMVYGTGYPYTGWYGTYYYGPSVTFGFGFSYYPYYGWGGGYPVYPVRPIGGWGRPGVPGNIAPRPTPYAGGDRPQAKQNVYNRPETRRGQHTNNVYADRDGNVSRQIDSGKWQDRSGNRWKDNAAPSRDIQRDSQARDRGAQRTAQYQGSAISRPSYGGGMRGGGGRGGRR